MRKLLFGVLATALSAGAALAQTYGLGVNAPSPDSVVLKIDGRNQTFTVGGGATTKNAEAFLTCLVNDRVLKVVRKGGSAQLFMLDNSNVADLLREYLQSNTSTDPCTLGKAAYTPKPPALAGEAPQAAVVAAPAPPPAPAAEPKPAAKKKLGRKAAAASSEPKVNATVLGTAMPLPPPPPPKNNTFPTESSARATSLGTAPVETPSTASTAPGLAAGSTERGIQPGSTTTVGTGSTVPSLQPAPTPSQPATAPPPPPKP